MKKLLTVLILMTVIIVPSFAAVTDMMVNIGLMNTSSVLSIEPEKDKVFDFNIDLQADFNLIFDNGPGVRRFRTSTSLSSASTTRT